MSRKRATPSRDPRVKGCAPHSMSAYNPDESERAIGWVFGLAAGSHRHVTASLKLTRPEALACAG